MIRVATHLEIREKVRGKIFMKTSVKNDCFANVLENIDITCFISIRTRVINVNFCYTANKLESGKSQGK